MNRRQYKPDLSVKYSPRTSRRLRKLVDRICRKYDMPEADVLRYSFEAAVLTASASLRRSTSAFPASSLDAMLTVRTSKVIARQVGRIWQATPNVLKADILRALLESMLTVAERKGMAHVMAIRESALNRGLR